MASIGKIFTGDGTYDGNDIFRYLSDSGIMPCIKVRKNAQVRLKKDAASEICLLYPRKRIYKSGRIALAMDKDGL